LTQRNVPPQGAHVPRMEDSELGASFHSGKTLSGPAGRYREVRRLSDTSDLTRGLNTLKQDMAALRGDVTTRSESSAQTAREGIQAIMDAAKEATAQAREKITQEAEHLAEKVRQGAQDVAHKARETGTAALEEVEHQVRERPLTSVLTALGVGF